MATVTIERIAINSITPTATFGTSAGEADPYAMVLFGPLTPTGVYDPNIALDDIAYLRQVYQYQDGIVKDYFDILGAHVAGSNNQHSPAPRETRQVNP